MMASLNAITECCELVKRLPGDAAEIGVYMGESAALICELLPESTVYLFDSLGIPASQWTPQDGHRPGDFTGSVVEIRRNLRPHRNYSLHIGVFPATAVDIELLRFVHVDCDLHRTATAALEWAWPRMVAGGVLLFDDYCAANCVALRRAVDEWCDLNGVTKNTTGSRLWVAKHDKHDSIDSRLPV